MTAEVRVRVLRAVEEAPGDRALLSADERAQAERFHFARDRVLYVTAHAALRRALAELTHVAPEALEFEREKDGRPRLVGHDVGFSLSHSGDRVLVATGGTRWLGVDVEVFRDGIDLRRLAARNFSAAEQAALAELEGEPLRRAFFRVWTRKEAYVKALGRGLVHPLDAFDVASGDDARFLGFRDGSQPEAWGLFDLDVGPGRAAALAVSPPPAGVDLVPAGADRSADPPAK